MSTFHCVMRFLRSPHIYHQDHIAPAYLCMFTVGSHVHNLTKMLVCQMKEYNAIHVESILVQSENNHNFIWSFTVLVFVLKADLIDIRAGKRWDSRDIFILVWRTMWYSVARTESILEIKSILLFYSSLPTSPLQVSGNHHMLSRGSVFFVCFLAKCIFVRFCLFCPYIWNIYYGTLYTYVWTSFTLHLHLLQFILYCAGRVPTLK